MADEKVSALTITTSPASSDLLYGVINPGSSPASRQMTIDDLFLTRTGNKNVTAYASLSAAISAIGTAQATIEIPASAAVSADLTVPSNITLLFAGTGIIPVSSGKVLTINGPVFAPMRQLFSGAGSVRFNSPQPFYPQWAGAKSDCKVVSDAAMTASSATLTSATAAFTSADVGKIIDVNRVGAATTLTAQITGYTSTTVVTLSIPASYTGSSKTITLDNATIATGSMTAGSATLTAGSAFFTSDDVGKLVTVTSVGAKNMVGTISSYTNATTVTLSFSATVSATATKAAYGTDNHAAIAFGITALANGGELFFPQGNYAVGAALVFTTSNLTFSGAGMNVSNIYAIGPLMLDSPSIFHLFDLAQPASNIHFEALGLSGTNWNAQTSVFGGDSADGVYIGVTGPMQNISANNCRFDSFWGVGFHNPGSTGGTIEAAAAVKNITITNCQASYNSYDGLNPNPISGLIVTGCILHHNGSGGIEAATTNGIIDVFAYYNFLAGASIGGFGGTETGANVIVRGVYKYNGVVGVVIAVNMTTAKVVGVHASFNGYIGIQTTGSDAVYNGNHTITDCTVNNNGNIGIDIGAPNCEVRSCRVDGHTTGISIESGGVGSSIHTSRITNSSSKDILVQAASLYLGQGNLYDKTKITFQGSGTLAAPVYRGENTFANNTTTGIFDVTLPTLTGVSGTLSYRCFQGAGGDVQLRSGLVRFSAVNKAGTYSSEIVVVSEGASVGSGTLTGTWSIVTGTNKITLKFNGNSSLFGSVVLDYTFQNESEQEIVPL